VPGSFNSRVEGSQSRDLSSATRKKGIPFGLGSYFSHRCSGFPVNLLKDFVGRVHSWNSVQLIIRIVEHQGGRGTQGIQNYKAGPDLDFE
jgi:hypothetical protein